MAETQLRYDFTKLRVALAMRGAYSTAAPVNLATHTLFNNSTGAHMMVIRSISWFSTASSDVIAGAATQTPPGAVLGVKASLVTGGQVGPGALYYSDQAAAITPDFILGGGGQSIIAGLMPPFAILQPGWGFTVQNNVIAHALAVAWIWEFLDPVALYSTPILDQP